MRGNMRAERVRRGLTATDVAKVVGVHPNALLRWEKGTLSQWARTWSHLLGSMSALPSIYSSKQTTHTEKRLQFREVNQ